LTTDILHNLRNAERIPFLLYFRSKILPPLNGVSIKISCLFLTESLHDIVESSHYIPHDRLHMRTREIKLNLCAVIAPKETDNANARKRILHRWKWTTAMSNLKDRGLDRSGPSADPKNLRDVCTK